MGQVDGAGSGGLVDPGVALAACWVFIVGSLSAGEGRQAGGPVSCHAHGSFALRRQSASWSSMALNLEPRTLTHMQLSRLLPSRREGPLLRPLSAVALCGAPAPRRGAGWCAPGPFRFPGRFWIPRPCGCALRCYLFYSLNTKAVTVAAAAQLRLYRQSRKQRAHRAEAPKRQKPTVRTPPICRPPIEHQWKETSGQPSRGQAPRSCTSPTGPEGPGAAWAWARGRGGGAMIPAAAPHGAYPEARRLSRGSRLGLCPLALRRWLRAKRRGRRAARGGALPGRSAVRDRLARAPRPCSIPGSSMAPLGWPRAP